MTPPPHELRLLAHVQDDAVLSINPPDVVDPACYPIGNPELWFSIEPHQIEQARAICRRCPSIRPCLKWALENRPTDGVWAATTPNQREQLLTRHKKEPATA